MIQQFWNILNKWIENKIEVVLLSGLSIVLFLDIILIEHRTGVIDIVKITNSLLVFGTIRLAFLRGNDKMLITNNNHTIKNVQHNTGMLLEHNSILINDLKNYKESSDKQFEDLYTKIERCKNNLEIIAKALEKKLDKAHKESYEQLLTNIKLLKTLLKQRQIDELKYLELVETIIEEHEITLGIKLDLKKNTIQEKLKNLNLKIIYFNDKTDRENTRD